MKGLKFFLLVLIFSFLSTPVFATDLTAQGAVLIDGDTGSVLWEKNKDKELYPASTTKIMTALLVLENLHLGEEVTIREDFLNPGESSIWLEPGEVLSVKQLLLSLLLKSANDAGTALAIEISGSVAEFADLMNQKVKDLGLQHTHFVNPHGLHDPAHYTSAYDLAMIAQKAYQEPVFKKIIATPYEYIPWADNEYMRIVKNGNKLLQKYEYATGIKNGYTKAAGNCLVGAAEKDGKRLIAVVLHSNHMYDEVEFLLEKGFAQTKVQSYYRAEEDFAFLKVRNGVQGQIPLALAQDVSFLSVAGQNSNVDYQLLTPSFLLAPVKEGIQVGYAEFIAENGGKKRIPLVTKTSVAKKDVFSSLWQEVFGAIRLN